MGARFVKVSELAVSPASPFRQQGQAGGGHHQQPTCIMQSLQGALQTDQAQRTLVSASDQCRHAQCNNRVQSQCFEAGNSCHGLNKAPPRSNTHTWGSRRADGVQTAC